VPRHRPALSAVSPHFTKSKKKATLLFAAKDEERNNAVVLKAYLASRLKP
jgi:uncharacterized protein YeaO (DUF488 family)